MRLKTLIEVQACFALLRAAEKAIKPLSGEDYVRCLSAQTIFEYELSKHLEKMPSVEIEGAAA